MDLVFYGITLNYVLELEDGCWYIGMTTNLNVRLAQHLTGKASNWTKLHKFKRLVEVRIGNRTTEDTLTIEYTKKYGNDKVRGGSWTRIDKGYCKRFTIEYWLKCIDPNIFN
jgi:predicted GIY-YIG superfamily endonuclease